MMPRRYTAVLLAGVWLAACSGNIRNKEKVQEAIVERLKTRTGLSLDTIDVNTTSVSFHKNMAYATVAFHPKGDSNLASGMTMTYTLENRGGKWEVIKVGDSQGHTLGEQMQPGGNALPPGHPPIDSQSQNGQSQ